ncbi:hypothetical protein Tco_0252144 [Tanacetum coccineum]
MIGRRAVRWMGRGVVYWKLVGVHRRPSMVLWLLGLHRRPSVRCERRKFIPGLVFTDTVNSQERIWTMSRIPSQRNKGVNVNGEVMGRWSDGIMLVRCVTGIEFQSLYMFSWCMCGNGLALEETIRTKDPHLDEISIDTILDLLHDENHGHPGSMTGGVSFVCIGIGKLPKGLTWEFKRSTHKRIIMFKPEVIT